LRQWVVSKSEGGKRDRGNPEIILVQHVEDYLSVARGKKTSDRANVQKGFMPSHRKVEKGLFWVLGVNIGKKRKVDSKRDGLNLDQRRVC